MSTNTKKKRGTGAAVVIIVLCLAALGALGYVIWQQFHPAVPETAAGYVASAESTAPVYDENGELLGSLPRGSEVQYVLEDAQGDAQRIRVVNGEGYACIDRANLTDDYAAVVQVETVYALRGMSLVDETGAVPGCAVEKGMALTVTGFDGLDENGEVSCIYCTADLATKSGCEGADRKVKGNGKTLHWVSATQNMPFEARLYDVLILDGDKPSEESAPAPDVMATDESDDAEETVDSGDDFLRQVNPDSLKVVHGYGEPWLAEAKVGDSFQFMRTAYFCKDKDSTDDMAVFNRVVILKDSYKPEV